MSCPGKIARLSRPIREELNRRLDQGEPGSSLLPWLNGLPEVRDILLKHFERRAINDQNLSEWRLGGFAKWQRRQEARFWLRDLVDTSADFLEETKLASVADCLSAPVAIVLGQIIERLAENASTSLEDRQGLLALVRELNHLRRGDHQCARLRRQNEPAQSSLGR